MISSRAGGQKRSVKELEDRQGQYRGRRIGMISSRAGEQVGSVKEL
jgi:hypothetical protein